MFSFLSKSILLTLLSFGMTAPSFAQGFSWSPVNVKAKKLPVYYLGHSPSTVYPAFESKKISKGRYETTSQYEARRNRLTSKPLFGQTFMWSPLGFCIPPSWCDYNADTRIFTAHFALYKDTEYSFDNSDFSSASSFEYLRTLTQSYQDYSRSYRAQNAFGAETTVYSEGTTNYGVGIINWKDFRFVPTESSGEKCRLSYQTTLSPVAAQRLEKNIRLLLVGYSTTPYQITDYSGRTATYTSPFAEDHRYYFVALRLKEAWFYDITSGYIFSKTTPIEFGSVKTPTSGEVSQSNNHPAKETQRNSEPPRNADGSVKTNENCCSGVIKSIESEFLPASRSEIITSAQISAFSDTNLRLAINEMFARYGLTFKDPTLQTYFCARSWYKPDVLQTGEGIFRKMSETETKNLQALTAERTRRKKN